MPSAEEVWMSEAQIVPADETTSVSTTVDTTAFLRRVGATESSVMKTQKDRDTVAHFERELAAGRQHHSTLHLDSSGNVIGADGRHRAIAALRSGQHRINVVVTRRTR